MTRYFLLRRLGSLSLFLFCVSLGVLLLAQDTKNDGKERGSAANGDTQSAKATKSTETSTADQLRLEQLRKVIREHLSKVDASPDKVKAVEFPEEKKWFNSPPLSYERELRGKLVVLDFWTYCCINCIHVLPDLEYLERKYAGRPVAFVGVHSAKFDNEKVAENVRQAVLRYEIHHPVINDDEMHVWRGTPGVNSWPTMAVVSPRGHMILIVSGEGNRELLDEFLAAALEFYPAEAFDATPIPLRLEKRIVERASPLRYPGKLAIDAAGRRLFISDSNHHRIVVTDLEGQFLTSIGTGRRGLKDGSFDEAEFFRLQGLAYEDGKLYVADAENHALRLVDFESKTVRTLVGDGEQSHDRQGGGVGTAQQISTPWDVLVRGDLVYIAMAGRHQIWTYEPATGRCQNFSGNGREQNFNSPHREQAAWSQPSGLTIGGTSLYIADSESSAIRSIDLSSEEGPTASIVGGDDASPRDLFAFGDVDGVGDAARLQHPLGVLWIESKKRIAVADTYNHRLKLVDPSTRTVVSWVGDGISGFKDGPGVSVRFSEPAGFALGPDGKKLYVADANNHAIRIVEIETGTVSTLKLLGVPQALSAIAPRSESLADLPGTPTVQADTLVVKAGNQGEIRLRIRLPEGHKFLEAAPSRWQVARSANLAVTIDEAAASGDIKLGEDIVISLRASAKAISGKITIEALAYYCEAQGSCKISAVRIEVPVKIIDAGEGFVASGKDASGKLSVEYRFRDLDPRGGVGLPGFDKKLPGGKKPSEK